MPDQTEILTELEEQRCLIEQQRVEMQRMQRHINLQRELVCLIQTELDTLKIKFLPRYKPTRQKPSGGHERVMVSHTGREAVS